MFGSRKNRMRMQFLKQWGSDPRELPAAHMTRERLPYIRMYHDVCREKGVDEITWSDLEMDEVFLRINHTRSFVGEQVLYHELHETESGDALNSFEKLVSVFGCDEDGRWEYEYRLSAIGKRQEDYYLPAALEMIADHRGVDIRIYRCLQLLLAAAVIGTLCTKNAVCAVLAVAAACTNLIIYTVRKWKQESMFSCLRAVCVILRFCRFAERNWPLEDETMLQQVREDLAGLRMAEQSAGSFAAKKSMASGDPQYLLADYVYGMTLIDLVMYEKIMAALAGSEDAVLRLFRFAGIMDAAIACASFRESLDFWCEPSFGPEEKISFQGMYHPLLAFAVPGSGEFGKSIMITGANASGKSTFMKGIAVNVILAQTLHTCAAHLFAMPAMDVMSSMAIRDDVILGESYYVREVRYMKRMLCRLEENRPVLFIIDEIMKGTNQRESLAVSEALLRYLKKRDCFVIAATHDYELTERLCTEYEQYYFDCRYEDGRLYFDYRIRPGTDGGTNAVRLLKQFGYPEEILGDIEVLLKKGAAL